MAGPILLKRHLSREISTISPVRVPCSEESVHVGGVNSDASVVTFDLSHVDILVENLLGDEVNIPETESIVVDGDQLIVGVVEEFDLVSDVHSNVVSDKGFTGLDL